MDSYFDDTSMLRRVHREFAVALSGPRALLMQAAHPVAFEGFFAHSGALDEPYERLRRTAAVMNTIGFGERADADRATRRVRAMHGKVRGELERPPGAFRRARRSPPTTRSCCCGCWRRSSTRRWSSTTSTSQSLSQAEREAYWQDYRVIGGLFGLQDHEMPADIRAFDDYMRGMLEGDDLFVTSAARELALQIVMRPPVPLTKRPGARGRELRHGRAAAGDAAPAVRPDVGSAARAHAARRRGVRQARARAARAGAAAVRVERSGVGVGGGAPARRVRAAALRRMND